MASTEDCCCGDRCSMGGKCNRMHKCLKCKKYLHAICGVEAPDDPDERICFDCQSKKDNKEVDNDDKSISSSSDVDDLTLEALGEKRKPKSPPKQQPPKKKKKKKRKERPAATYEDDPTVDASNWSFPVDKPEYKAPFMEFMRFIDGTSYPKSMTFSKAKLLTLQPKHVLAFLTHKAFGKIKITPEDRPIYARSNHLKNLKMKISYFMPTGSAWVDLPDGSGHGNPTRHKAINKLINDIIKFETRGEGAESKDVRDMTMAEFRKELELFREHKDALSKFRNPLIGIYQWHFITRCDDVCNFKVDAAKSNPQFEFALAQSVKWSKNVVDARNCPDQLLLASMEHKSCIFLALSVWLEYFLGNYPQAVYMMTDAVPAGKSKEQHKKFTNAIQKTYRNRLVSVVFRNKDFMKLYKGSDKRGLGLHSKRKMASTQASRRGATGEQVDHRGRWVNKKGSRIVTGVYIDPEDIYADAVCASKLSLGGPIKYKLKEEVASHITTAWLSEFVVPNIAKRFSADPQLVKNLGLAYLWLCLDKEASEDLQIPDATAERVKTAYDALPLQDDKPEQAVNRVPLHVYRDEEETIIDEIVAEELPRDQEGRNVADSLAQIPASGGTTATQHVLKTLVLQQRLLQRQQQELENRISNVDASNRAWLENRFRQLNGNIRRFGGTIQGGLVRQDPNRQAEVRRATAEVPLEEDRQGAYQHRGRRLWPRLAPNIKDLMQLWTEYEHGIGGRKAAREWSAIERGGGGDQKIKQTYYRRNMIWRVQVHLINKGNNIHRANAIIEQTYGKNTAITEMSKAIVRDRKTYKAFGGLHPNFR